MRKITESKENPIQKLKNKVKDKWNEGVLFHGMWMKVIEKKVGLTRLKKKWGF